MPGVPQEVMDAFTYLKHDYPFYITLKRINKKFYVYRATTRWDKKEKCVKSLTEYLGRITETGRFIEKVQKAQVLKSQETKPDEMHIRHAEMLEHPPLDAIDKTLLTILSTNAKH